MRVATHQSLLFLAAYVYSESTKFRKDCGAFSLVGKTSCAMSERFSEIYAIRWILCGAGHTMLLSERVKVLSVRSEQQLLRGPFRAILD